MCKVVGVVKHSLGQTRPRELGAVSRALRAARRLSQALDTGDGSGQWMAGQSELRRTYLCPRRAIEGKTKVALLTPN
jgi:hypothetical protein